MDSQKTSIVAMFALLAAFTFFIFTMWQVVEHRREGFNEFARRELEREVGRQNRVFADTGAYIISHPARFSTMVWSKAASTSDGARWVGIAQDSRGLQTFCYDSQSGKIVTGGDLETCLMAFNTITDKA